MKKVPSVLVPQPIILEFPAATVGSVQCLGCGRPSVCVLQAPGIYYIDFVVSQNRRNIYTVTALFAKINQDNINILPSHLAGDSTQREESRWG